MKPNQKLSPKYWVVHDKKSDDVFINTASKNKRNAVDIFVDDNSWDRWQVYLKDEDLLEMFYNDKDLEVILIEVKEVKGG